MFHATFLAHKHRKDLIVAQPVHSKQHEDATKKQLRGEQNCYQHPLLPLSSFFIQLYRNRNTHTPYYI